MKLSFLFSLFSLAPKKSFIENGEYPLCKNCIYYRPNPFEILTPYQFGKCTKYGKKEVVSGMISYEYADLCRKNNEKCGVSGKNYVGCPDLLVLINNTFQSFSEKSSKSSYVREKIQSTYDNNQIIDTSKMEELYENSCASEQKNCSTEFCNECYSEKYKKKATTFIDVDVVSANNTKY